MAKLLTEFIAFDQLEVLKETVGEGIDKKTTYKLRGPFLEAETKNKNGRIYPKSVLVREVDDFIASKIKKNRSVGELEHPACNFSSNFDVLTTDGWMPFLSLSVGRQILTRGRDGNIEIQPIQNIINEPYKGHGYHIKSRNIDSSFTPTHRFVLQNRYGKIEYVTLEEIYKNRTKYNKYKIIKTANWVGNNKDYIVIPGIKDIDMTHRNFKNDISQDLVIDTLTFVRFLGIWLSEGSVSKDNYIVSIFQNAGEKADAIKDLLDNFPLQWNVYHRDNKMIFSLSDIRLSNYLKDLGDCYTKYIPYEIKQLDSMYLQELIDWFIIGDGRHVENEYGVRENMFSVSKRLIEDLHECLIKTGRAGNWTEYNCDKDYMFADHLIEAKNKSTLYQLNISQCDGIYLDNRFVTIEEVQHNGNVFCLTVENSNFYMKENNKSFWTGNSPQINLERVSHIIEELYWKDNVGMGIARLIDTPMGRIAETLTKEGIMMGMSTRGVGSLDGEMVKDDYKLITVDIVADPSAPNCFVEGVLENKEYIIGKDGDIVEIAVKKLQEQVDKKVDRCGESKLALQYMMEFINNIRKK